MKKKENHEVIIKADDNFKLLGNISNNLVELQNCTFNAISSTSQCYLSSPANTDWHSRLGHPNDIYQKFLVPDSALSSCEVCRTSKLKAPPFCGKFKEVQDLECVHIDRVGPFPVASIRGNHYFLTIVDELSS